jgi:hypothetical protein
MSKTAYCYTCNAQHPLEEMRQVMTTRGARWRCISSINAARQAVARRQEFGARTTANNKSDAQTRGRSLAAIRRDSAT